MRSRANPRRSPKGSRTQSLQSCVAATADRFPAGMPARFTALTLYHECGYASLTLWILRLLRASSIIGTSRSGVSESPLDPPPSLREAEPIEPKSRGAGLLRLRSWSWYTRSPRQTPTAPPPPSSMATPCRSTHRRGRGSRHHREDPPPPFAPEVGSIRCQERLRRWRVVQGSDETTASPRCDTRESPIEDRQARAR